MRSVLPPEEMARRAEMNDDDGNERWGKRWYEIAQAVQERLVKSDLAPWDPDVAYVATITMTVVLEQLEVR